MTKRTIEEVFRNVRNLAPRTNQFQIVTGKNYVYFCIQPSQEGVTFERILHKHLMDVFVVFNCKQTVVGYVVGFERKPNLNVSSTGDGISFCFHNLTRYRKTKILFTDKKLRILGMDNRDFYVAIKWKSNNQLEGL